MINVRIYFGVYFEHLKCACYTTEGVLVVHSYICLFVVKHLTWRRLFHWGALGFWSRRGGGEVSVQGISGGLDARDRRNQHRRVRHCLSQASSSRLRGCYYLYAVAEPTTGSAAASTDTKKGASCQRSTGWTRVGVTRSWKGLRESVCVGTAFPVSLTVGLMPSQEISSAGVLLWRDEYSEQFTKL
jgi:hypothetical protein